MISYSVRFDIVKNINMQEGARKAVDAMLWIKKCGRSSGTNGCFTHA